MRVPKISVLMTAYNSEKYIRSAIDSIINQTYTDFELLIIDDGSQDRTISIVREYYDSRIRLICNPKNLGVGGARQVGLMHAKGEYIAILDSDDIAYPQRLEIQYHYLEKNKDIVLLGTGCEYSDNKGIIQKFKTEQVSSTLKWILLFRNPFINSTVMYRRDLAIALGGYDLEMRISEDYLLFSRFAERYQVAQISDLLCWLRRNHQSLTSLKDELLVSTTILVVKRNVEKLIDERINDSLANALAYKVLDTNINPQEVFTIYEKCLNAFIKKYAWTKEELSKLLSQIIIDLRAYSEAFKEHSMRPIIITLKFVFRHAPQNLLSSELFLFLVRNLLPYEFIILKRKFISRKK